MAMYDVVSSAVTRQSVQAYCACNTPAHAKLVAIQSYGGAISWTCYGDDGSQGRFLSVVIPLLVSSAILTHMAPSQSGSTGPG